MMSRGNLIVSLVKMENLGNISCWWGCEKSIIGGSIN